MVSTRLNTLVNLNSNLHTLGPFRRGSLPLLVWIGWLGEQKAKTLMFISHLNHVRRRHKAAEASQDLQQLSLFACMTCQQAACYCSASSYAVS